MVVGLQDGRRPEELKLRLFVSGATSRSLRAVAAVRKLCDAELSGRCSLEVIDIYRNPAAARENQVLALPTLMKLAPVPKRMFVGDMSDMAPLVSALGLTGFGPAGVGMAG